MHRQRILVALLAAFAASILAMSTRDGAAAHSASAASVTADAAQTGFTLTSPAESALVPCGQPITVTWTGGNPTDNVNLVLIDVQAFQVFQGFGVEPNTGSRIVTIGPGSCGRTSRFYVEDSPVTTWTYGPVFMVGSSTTCTSPPPDLVSWWPGDGNANDIQDGNNGALQNGGTFAAGKVGQAFNFNGNNQYVLITDSASLHAQQLTVDAWVYPRSSGDVNDAIGPVIFVKDRGTSQNSPISYGLYGPGNTGRFSVHVEFTDNTTFNLFSTNAFQFNQWYHVAATWDGNVARLYVNGNPEGSLSVGSKTIIYSSDNAAIGRQIHVNRSFDGLIDEVELFGRPLSSSEIFAVYLADSAGKCKPPADTTPPIVSCPSPSTAPADDSCQARVPDVLSGVTVSDNSGGTVTLSQSPAAGTLVGLGTTTITVTATDAANNSAICTTTLTVTDNTPPTITAPTDISVVDNAAGSCGASVNPGTPMTSDSCGIASVVGVRSDGQALSALYPVGATVITWAATDNSGHTACAQQNVVVTNPAPQVSIIGPPSGALYVVNTPVNFTGSFTDNAGDSHTAIWTFDGAPQAGTVDEMTHTVSTSHTFDTAGVYLVTLSVTDDCGQTVSTNQVGGFDALVVIYDPDAGFVTGGGWINSPAGAYVANPSLIGKANFGFVSKYQKGANVPDGQTEFQFKVANLNFHSTIYEWLVVAGARAQYKGSGTINGAGNYGFMLTAIDGQISGGGGIDKFRIKIWDKNNGDAVVYDNQMGAGIDDNPTTALAGGSIVIHK